jgi:hypothetical protein
LVQIVQKTFSKIHDKAFIATHKTAPQAFTRQRKLPFHQLVTFLLNLVKGSVQDELDAYFQAFDKEILPQESVTKAAFSKARRYLSHTAFTALTDELNHHVDTEGLSPTWKGHRVYAVDGSRVNLPDTPDILEHFGGQKSQNGLYPQALLSQCYNVHSGLTLDAIVSPCRGNERVLAAEHLKKTNPNDILIYDRGYSAFLLYAQHNQHQRYFVMRLKTQRPQCEVSQFLKEASHDKEILLSPTYNAKNQLKSHDLPTDDLRLRLIKTSLPNGEVEILITNLLDTRYTPDDFNALYALRWSVEEDYKRLKKRLSLESFSGKTVNAVLQDIHAKILSKNLTLLLTMVANQQIETKNTLQKWRYQINVTQAFSNMKHQIVQLIKQANPQGVIEYLLKWFCSRIEPIRPNRSFSRKAKFGSTKRFRGNYKHVR